MSYFSNFTFVETNCANQSWVDCMMSYLIFMFTIIVDAVQFHLLYIFSCTRKRNYHIGFTVKICVLINFILMFIYLVVFKNELEFFLLCLIVGALLAFLNLKFSYSELDMALVQDPLLGIGALWAVGAFKSYYEINLERWPKQIREFEKKHKISLFKQFIIICPLSCNINGSLRDKNPSIKKFDEIILTVDQGADFNRRYKKTIYKLGINDPIYFAAEFASPLGTLWESKNSLQKELFQHHRQCFINTLCTLVKRYPCVVLEYDDEDSNETESLDDFLRSSIKQLSF